MTEKDSLVARLTAPIANLELYGPQEVFDIMCGRIKTALSGEPPQPVTDAWECANQLAGYVGPDTEDRLAEFLLQESRAAEELAKEIVRQSEQIASLIKERDDYKDDYLRRHKDAVDRWEALKIAEARLAEVKSEAIAATTRYQDAENEVHNLKARLAELEQEAVKVVEPFAKIASEYSPREDDDFNIMGDRDVLGEKLILRKFRAARAFLDKLRRSS